MATPNGAIYMVYITCKDRTEAKSVVRTLLEQRLIACATMTPTTSMYWWQEKKEITKEVIILAKTTEKKVTSIIRTVKKIHSYTIPCILAWKIDAANKDYLKWVNEVTKGKQRVK